MKRIKYLQVHIGSIISLLLLIAAIPVTTHLVLNQQQVNQHASGGNVAIDYSRPPRTLNPLAVGGVDESAYGGKNVLVNDVLQQQKLKALRPKYMRINLRYSIPGDPTSKIICGAQACNQPWGGDEWVNAIKALGATPVVEDPVNPSDLPLLVKHFNKDTNNRVARWLGGINEPDIHGQDATTYSNNFNTTYDAMKAVDPTIKIGGPTNCCFNRAGFMQTFLTISGSRVDFLDYHNYAQGPTSLLSTDQLFARAAAYETEITDYYNRIKATVPSRASQIEVEVGEWDLNYAGTTLEYTQFDTAWGASALGHIVKTGGIDLHYGDKGSLLLKTGNEIPGGHLDDTTPMYHALGMYTGEGLFPHFGNVLVQATTALPNVEIYASDNPKNIVVINKDPSLMQNAVFQLNGIGSGTVTVWRKDQSMPITNPPQQMGIVALLNGSFSFPLPPFSVTTFVVSGATGVPTTMPITPSPIAVSPTAPVFPQPSLQPTGTQVPQASYDCNGEGVYIYSKSNFMGTCSKFTADIPQLRGTPVGSDTAASIKIVGSYLEILYKDSNYRGPSDLITHDVPDLQGTQVGRHSLSSIHVQKIVLNGQQVTGFSIINADSKQPITGLTNLSNAVTIKLSQLPTTHLDRYVAK